jgi:hypothetical protein
MVLQNKAVIYAEGTNSAIAAKAATRTVPIVFNIGSDPVELGLVASFNRPGGNLTGVGALGTEISAKRLELLRKLVPRVDVIATLVGSVDLPYDQAEIRGLQSAARALGVRLLLLAASSKTDIAAAFATLVEQRAGAVLLGGAAPLGNARDHIISLAARDSIPTMFYYAQHVRAAGCPSPTAVGKSLRALPKQKTTKLLLSRRREYVSGAADRAAAAQNITSLFLRLRYCLSNTVIDLTGCPFTSIPVVVIVSIFPSSDVIRVPS